MEIRPRLHQIATSVNYYHTYAQLLGISGIQFELPPTFAIMANIKLNRQVFPYETHSTGRINELKNRNIQKPYSEIFEQVMV